jgi:signal transduction histidine kinase
VKDDGVSFNNLKFDSILERFPSHVEDILGLKILKVPRAANEDEVGENVSDQTYSLREILTQSNDFLEDKIFEVLNSTSHQKFRYVHLKVKKIKEWNNFTNNPLSRRNQGSKTLVQILDMSDKMLYNEVKAEQAFLTLINAAVSHELRNPLSSLIS